MNNIFLKQITTEKSNINIKSNNRYIFLVNIHCNKIDIKKKLFDYYGIHALKIRTITYKSKGKSFFKKNRWIHSKITKFKKAIIDLKIDQKINISNNKNKN